MLFLDFLKWWYGPGWALRVRMLAQHLKNLSEYFSLGTLLTTLFSPWRQNISRARPDQSINDKLTALLDNVVSRTIGFLVRVIVFFVAIIILTFTLILNATYILIWPLIPLSPAIILAVGVMS